MPLPQPDLAILRKAQRGDERAFAIILRTYETPVYNYVLRLTNGDKALAEDLTQEVFLRVFQGLPKFSLRCKFTTWLFQVTKNRVLDELRARERRPSTPVNLDDAPQLEVVDQPVEQVETIDALWRSIEQLPVDLKMALLLRDRRPLVQRDRRLARDHPRGEWRILGSRGRQVALLGGASRGVTRIRPSALKLGASPVAAQPGFRLRASGRALSRAGPASRRGMALRVKDAAATTAMQRRRSHSGYQTRCGVWPVHDRRLGLGADQPRRRRPIVQVTA